MITFSRSLWDENISHEKGNRCPRCPAITRDKLTKAGWMMGRPFSNLILLSFFKAHMIATSCIFPAKKTTSFGSSDPILQVTYTSQASAQSEYLRINCFLNSKQWTNIRTVTGLALFVSKANGAEPGYEKIAEINSWVSKPKLVSKILL